MSDPKNMNEYVRLGLVATLVLLLSAAAMAQDAKKTEAIDFRKLKEWLPAELNGIKRSSADGERNKIGEMTMSQARATYQKGEDENTPRIELELTDYGGIKDMAAGIASAWTMAEIDKESDGGYEKTVKIKDQPGFERWEKEGKQGEVQILVGKRYILIMRTSNIPADQLKKVAESLALDKLAALK